MTTSRRPWLDLSSDKAACHTLLDAARKDLDAYWKTHAAGELPLDTVSSVMVPLALWLAETQAAIQRPLLFGITGSIGQGKSTLTDVVGLLLNHQRGEHLGRTIGISLDDYYLPKSDRCTAEFLARGYNPEGISNRGPAGTHDVLLLADHVNRLLSNAVTEVEIPVFDKQLDDRASTPRLFSGKAGIVLLEGWFLGCRTNVKSPPQATPLQRSVIAALPSYAPIFHRLDGLWAFERPPVADIAANRWTQQETLDRQTGRRGMSQDQIARFVRYFYEDAWIPGLSSPDPDPELVTFRACTGPQHHYLSVEATARARQPIL